MKGNNNGTIFIPKTDKEMIQLKHWLIARDINFKTVYIPVTMSKSDPIIMCNLDWVDKLLYRLTFKSKNQHVQVFG